MYLYIQQCGTHGQVFFLLLFDGLLLAAASGDDCWGRRFYEIAAESASQIRRGPVAAFF